MSRASPSLGVHGVRRVVSVRDYPHLIAPRDPSELEGSDSGAE